MSGSPEKKSQLYKMLESPKGSLSRSIGDLAMSSMKLVGVEERVKRKNEKIEYEQIETLTKLIASLYKHCEKFKVCEKHLKKNILQNKHLILTRDKAKFDENIFHFIKSFNQFVYILRIYKAKCQYLNPKKLQFFTDLIMTNKLDSINAESYASNFLNINRTPICDLSLEDSSESSSEQCTSSNESNESNESNSSEQSSSSGGEQQHSYGIHHRDISTETFTDPSSDIYDPDTTHSF